MIGLDTNVLVRYVIRDDADQAALASKLFRKFTTAAPGFVSSVTLAETVWVLRRFFKTPKPRIVEMILGFLNAREIVVEQEEEHRRALNLYRRHAIDFADAVIAQSGRRAGCEQTVTFDTKAAASAGMTLLTQDFR